MTPANSGPVASQESRSRPTSRKAAIRRIAIDLTPVLPGGDNGGAKLFALTLVKQLSTRHKNVSFILLTNPASHDELASLDRSNVSRQVRQGTISQGVRSRLIRYGSALGRRIPRRLQPVLMKAALSALAVSKLRLGAGPLRQQNIDLLFCPFTAPTFAEPGIPVVSTLYDLQYATYPEFFPPEDVAHRERTFRTAAKRSNLLVSISDYSRQAAITYGKLNPQKVRTVHLRMAKRADFDAAAGADVLARLGLKPDGYIIFPANFWRHKNHAVLLMAFRMAMAHGLPDGLSLVFTGAPGERGDWVKQSAEALGLGERVVFPGYVEDKALFSLMGQARAMVFPSLFEGFGLPVLEAMALGIPVACSNVTSLPEVAGDAALLFDPRKPADVAKAIVTIASDTELRAKLSTAGRLRAREFADETRMADEYWTCFSEAVGMSSRETIVYGLQPDGWTGTKLDIDVGHANRGDKLIVDLEAPSWAPLESVGLQINVRGRPRPIITIKRGETYSWTETLADGHTDATLQFSPTFRPGNGDERELSVLVRRCVLMRGEDTVELLAGA